MKQTRLLLIHLFLLLSYYGCKKPGCLGSAGPAISQERLVGSFSQLTLEDNIDLLLIQGDTEKIEITAAENIIPNIQTLVSNGMLTISNEADCRWMRNADEKIAVRLYFKDLSLINYNGSGNITNTDTLRLNILQMISEKGAGNIELTVDNQSTRAVILKENAAMTLHGRSAFCDTYANARGLLDLSDLSVQKMYLIYSGLADTHIQVSEELDATIRYKGNVYYKGDPFIKRSDYFSSGRLIKTP
jgi:hypothetical protein